MEVILEETVDAGNRCKPLHARSLATPTNPRTRGLATQPPFPGYFLKSKKQAAWRRPWVTGTTHDEKGSRNQ